MTNIFKMEEKCLIGSLGENWKREKHVHLVFMVYNLMGEICLFLYDQQFQNGRKMSCWKFRANWKWEKYIHLVFKVYNLMGEMCLFLYD